ncbi:unnamed protein product [Orchesella dallaii]|uniref:Uncharacterized protein n=1 Tax=Orchesella dallaii TaxID=48710 RepID=A0ABP1PTX4_9HEXA
MSSENEGEKNRSKYLYFNDPDEDDAAADDEDEFDDDLINRVFDEVPVGSCLGDSVHVNDVGEKVERKV